MFRRMVSQKWDSPHGFQQKPTSFLRNVTRGQENVRNDEQHFLPVDDPVLLRKPPAPPEQSAGARSRHHADPPICRFCGTPTSSTWLETLVSGSKKSTSGARPLLSERGYPMTRIACFYSYTIEYNRKEDKESSFGELSFSLFPIPEDDQDPHRGISTGNTPFPSHTIFLKNTANIGQDHGLPGAKLGLLAK